MKKRYVIVGASFRCYTLFVCNMTENMLGQAEIVGVYDPNKTRCEVFKKKIGEGLTIYDDFDKMLDSERPDGVVVTTSDLYHHDYIVRALDKGYDVFSEKPVTNTYERCLAIREAEKRSGKTVSVTFNMRFYPAMYALKQLVATGKIGKIRQVVYNHYLDRNHGADYFRRWHRYMKNSESLLLHKSTHHFDVVNWLLEDDPKFVSAFGNRVYFGNPERYKAECCRKCSDENCECFSLSQTREQDEEMYFNAEHEDGYVRDTCAFKPDTDIYDTMSVNVQYEGGALLSYTLNCYSSHECFRIKLIGDDGVLEYDSGCMPETQNSAEDKIYFESPKKEWEIIPIPKLAGTHAGSDLKLVKMLILGEGREADDLKQCADSYAGFSSAMIGVAGNESIQTRAVVDLTDRLKSLR